MSAVLVPIKMEDNPSPPPSPLPLPDNAPSCFFPNDTHPTLTRPLKRINFGGPATNTRSMSRAPAENTRSKSTPSTLRAGLSVRRQPNKKRRTTCLVDRSLTKGTIARAYIRHVNRLNAAYERRLTLITQEKYHPIHPWMVRRTPQVCVKK